MPASTQQRVQKRRDALRAAGLRPVQIWVPDTRAPGFAAEQYALARRHLVTRVLGIPGVREFPDGQLAIPDIDSGPVVFGMGPSASGFAVAASATMGDRVLAAELAQVAGAVGIPLSSDEKTHYALIPAVGEAVILYGKTLLLLPPKEQSP